MWKNRGEETQVHGPCLEAHLLWARPLTRCRSERVLRALPGGDLGGEVTIQTAIGGLPLHPAPSLGGGRVTVGKKGRFHRGGGILAVSRGMEG